MKTALLALVALLVMFTPANHGATIRSTVTNPYKLLMYIESEDTVDLALYVPPYTEPQADLDMVRGLVKIAHSNGKGALISLCMEMPTIATPFPEAALCTYPYYFPLVDEVPAPQDNLQHG